MTLARTRAQLCSAALALALLGCNVTSRGPLYLSDHQSDSGSDAGEAGPSSDTGDEAASGEPAASLSFVPEDDFDGVSECDSFTQDCPEGEKCVPYGSTGGNWDAYKCVPILGRQRHGEPCSYGGVIEATDDCDATSHCWNAAIVDDEAIGTCLAFCLGSADDPMCPPMSTCLISGSGIPGLCIPTCDPIAQDCGEGLACFWTNNDFNCVHTTQDIPPGEPCGFINDCAGGLACVVSELVPGCEGSACCTPFCDLGGALCEAVPGTVCLPFFAEGTAPPLYENVGLCMLPEDPMEDP